MRIRVGLIIVSLLSTGIAAHADTVSTFNAAGAFGMD